MTEFLETHGIQLVITAGGSGKRMWPLSLARYPKQFLVEQCNERLLEQATVRMVALSGSAAPMVLGNEEHRFLIVNQRREALFMSTVVGLEPGERDTKPVMTLAALRVMLGITDPALETTQADLMMPALAAFTATQEVGDGVVVMLGITPEWREPMPASSGHILVGHESQPWWGGGLDGATWSRSPLRSSGLRTSRQHCATKAFGNGQQVLHSPAAAKSLTSARSGTRSRRSNCSRAITRAARTDETWDGALLQVVNRATTPENRSNPRRMSLVKAATAPNATLGLAPVLMRQSWSRVKAD